MSVALIPWAILAIHTRVKTPWLYASYAHNGKIRYFAWCEDCYIEVSLILSDRVKLREFRKEKSGLRMWLQEVMEQAGNIVMLDRLRYFAVHTDGEIERF